MKTLTVTGKFTRKHMSGSAAYDPQIMMSGKWLNDFVKVGDTLVITWTDAGMLISHPAATPPTALAELKAQYQALGIPTEKPNG